MKETEKTAEKLGLSVGDSFEVETADGGRRSLTLTGITENYVFTLLYLSQAQLKTLNGGTLPAWNAVYGQTNCPSFSAVFSVRMTLESSKAMALWPCRVRKVKYSVIWLSSAAATRLTVSFSPSVL